VRRGAGVDGSDRVTVTFPDNVIRNRWLQVTVRANARTGLSVPDVFYFGHLAYDTGDTKAGAPAAVVDVRDEVAVRRAVSRAFVGAGSPFDFNKDGLVNATDVMLTRRAARSSLVMFTAPGAPAAAASVFSQTPVPIAGGRYAPPRRGSAVTADILTAP
jgi:hypothetical protein